MDPTDPAQRTRFLQAAQTFVAASNLLEQLNQFRREGFTKLRIVAATDTQPQRETLWFHGKLADDLFRWVSRGLLELVTMSAEAADTLCNILADPENADNPPAAPTTTEQGHQLPHKASPTIEGTSSTAPDSPVRWGEKQSTDLVYHGKQLPADHWILHTSTTNRYAKLKIARLVAELRRGKRIYIQTHPYNKQFRRYTENSPPTPAYIEVTERLLSSPEELEEYASPHYYYTMERIAYAHSKETRIVPVSILRSETCMLESMPGTYLPLD